MTDFKGAAISETDSSTIRNIFGNLQNLEHATNKTIWPGKHESVLPYSFNADELQMKKSKYHQPLILPMSNLPTYMTFTSIPLTAPIEKLKTWKPTRCEWGLYEYYDPHEEELLRLIMIKVVPLEIDQNMIVQMSLRNPSFSFAEVLNSLSVYETIDGEVKLISKGYQDILMEMQERVVSLLGDALTCCEVVTKESKKKTLRFYGTKFDVTPTVGCWTNIITSNGYYQGCLPKLQITAVKDASTIYLPIYCCGRLFVMRFEERRFQFLKNYGTENAIPLFIEMEDEQYYWSTTTKHNAIPDDRYLKELLGFDLDILPIRLLAPLPPSQLVRVSSPLKA
jgi:hypothetical protein